MQVKKAQMMGESYELEECPRGHPKKSLGRSRQKFRPKFKADTGDTGDT